ncbi:ABC transporter substrate-binding protein [Granulicella sp. L60]|uniref:ABC transporter substrate-binding protein n=1 Tax=Granulicella sp. L60 TaxID=1641866 RepID=UPI00131C1A4B|nr:PhnD/SsuA/transferrin family substrate-binding protein [Granulicella sp. L60]
MSALPASLFAEEVVKVEQPNAGSAGAVWKPLIEKAAAQTKGIVRPQWIGGDPGLSQVQLLAGAIDVGFFGPIGAVETDLRGNDVVIFAPGLINHGSWIVKGDSSFRTPEDLKNKRIATQPETSETYRQARLAASLNGLDLRRDFQVIFGPPTANLALFERGDVDAVITIEPISSRLIAKGAREIARVRDQWKKGTGDDRPLFLGGQGGRREWFDQNRSTARELAGLYIEANKQIKANPKLIADLHQVLGLRDDDRATIDLLVKRLPEIYSGEWSPAVANVANKVVDVAVTSGILKGKPARPICEIA